jgi:cell shape-determining protein MreC
MTTQRWTDEMLDDLAEAVEQTTHNVDLLVGAVNAFLERDRERAEEFQQYKLENEQYKLENDQRFNVLLEELRFPIRQLGENR